MSASPIHPTPSATGPIAPVGHVVLGAGPVARSVVAALVDRGIQPAVVTRSGTSIPGAVSRRADIGDADALAATVSGAQVIYQCAQPPYHRWPQEFPPLQDRVLAAAESSGALLVAAENLYGYAPPSGPLTEDLPLGATTRKGAVRAAMWHQLAEAHRSGRVRTVAARASDFFGPGVTASAVGDRFFGPLVAGKAVQVLGDPDRLHTYTYVVDFGEALVRLSETPTTWGQAWHVPNAPTTTTRAFAERAAAIAGTAARLKPVKPWQLRLAGVFVPALREMEELRYEFERDWVVSHERYAAVLGDHATDLDVALGATVAAASGATPAAA
jgi:nucleoside-diphosphate-sugar epimerase